ncbi:MAG: GT4 family glycosyltransferase PelF [Rhodospirillaceae bacterium]|nr:GT4 family glycosyltransferase PelF [Rhodospirillaceae bacterium]
MSRLKTEADVCLLLEGTYPYVSGGVSSWVHDIIRGLPEFSFHLVSLLPKPERRQRVYELPDNVVGLQHLYLQDLPRGWPWLPRAHRFFRRVEVYLEHILRRGSLDDMRGLVQLFAPLRRRIGADLLLESHASWDMLVDLYRRNQAQSPFLEYYYTFRALIGGLYAVLLAELPRARSFHAVSTGYAGALMSRAVLESGRPGVVTEHGIYTNERRIEITMADWIYDTPYASFSVDDVPRNLKDMWKDVFGTYSLACYQAAEEVLTIFGGNQKFQRSDGADPAKMRVIPNGVDVRRFSAIERTSGTRRPTVAMIGRVVPIKDIKTFIRACALLQQQVVELEALIIGPFDEDKEYAEECRDYVRRLGLENTVAFTGKVNVLDYLGRIDVVVLTSISEGQPLVLLEAGAAGIPLVATDVGACREIIMGREDEAPSLGPGGVVTTLTSPKATAEGMLHLLGDQAFYAKASAAIAERVRRYYDKAGMLGSYRQVYEKLINMPSLPRAATGREAWRASASR